MKADGTFCVGYCTRDDDVEVLHASFLAVLSQAPECEILVVDMSETDTIENLCTGFKQVRHIPYEKSKGISDSRNRLLAECATDILVSLDADAVPRRNWLTALLTPFTMGATVGVVGARCLPKAAGQLRWPFTTPTAGFMLGMFDLGDVACDVPRVMGTSFAIRTATSESMADRFRLDLGRSRTSQIAGEEVDFFTRIRASGWSIRYEPAAVVDHVIRTERLGLAWLLARAWSLGCESAHPALTRPEPIPLPSRNVRDHAFVMLIAPIYVAGRLVTQARQWFSMAVRKR